MRARVRDFDAIEAEALAIAHTAVEGVETITKADGSTEVRRGNILGHRKLQIETGLNLLANWDTKRYGERTVTASALNRDMTSLRAALNLALENGHATNDHAWRAKLRPVKDADGRRDIYLDAGQRKALIGCAPADLADFLRALGVWAAEGKSLMSVELPGR